MIDTEAPMSLGAFVAIVGILLTWVLGGIAIRKLVIEERKRRRDDDAHLEALILRVCQSFTESEAYQMRRDRAMISVAQSVSDEAFRVRSQSFVDTNVDAERRAQTERRLNAVESALANLRVDFRSAAADIAKEVTSQLRNVRSGE